MGPLRHVLRGGTRTPLQGPVLRDRGSARRGGTDAGCVPETLGTLGRDRADRGPDRLPVPRRLERVPDAPTPSGDGGPEGRPDPGAARCVPRGGDARGRAAAPARG